MPRSRTFLVVDDNEDNRLLARHALLRSFPSSRVVEAENETDAIAAAAKSEFDGVVTDHHLGECDGPAFMQHLRAAGIRCPVIMVTASSDPSMHRRAYAAGAAHVFAGSDWDFVSYFRRVLSCD